MKASVYTGYLTMALFVMHSSSARSQSGMGDHKITNCCPDASSDDVIKNKIVVVGEAQNAKAGAVVLSRQGKKIYYVEGLDYWDEKIIGKIVRVSGNLFIENKEEGPESKNQGDELRQEITGIKRIIQKPKWELFRP